MARLARRRFSSRSVWSSAITSPARRTWFGRYFGGDAVEQLDQVVGIEPGLAAGTAADRDPLIAERGPGHQPTLVHVADHVLIRNEDVIEEDLVEVGVAGHAAQRIDRHARAFMSIAIMVTPACLGASGSVRTVARPHWQC